MAVIPIARTPSPFARRRRAVIRNYLWHISRDKRKTEQGDLIAPFLRGRREGLSIIVSSITFLLFCLLTDSEGAISGNLPMGGRDDGGC